MTNIVNSGGNMPGAPPGQPNIPGPDQQAAGPLHNRNIIWKGMLEWQDKKGVMQGPSARITRSLQCMVSIGRNDPDIIASSWPTTLIMQLMPQTLLNSNQLHPLFKNSHQVAFHFHNTNLEDLRNLYKVMGSGFAGCVHFPTSTACDIRVLLLSFSNKRKSFVGLIPNDQSGVVNGIRQVITQHKQRMMQQTPGHNPMGGQVPGMPGMGQTNMGGMVPGPVTTPTATQMPGGTMGLQQNSMALDQDPQMMNSAAGLSLGKYTMEYADQCAHKRRHAEEISVLPVTKQRRLALKQEGSVNQITQESLDCTTYHSGPVGGVTDSMTNIVNSGGNMPGAPPGQPNIPGPDQQAAGSLNNRNIIWKGMLEWQDKKGVMQGPSARITRSLQCMVSIGRNDPDIITSSWPTTLIMHLMPQTLLNSNQLHPLFKNSHQVAFHFHNTNLEDLRNLYKVMGSAFAGCVHFPTSTACDIRVLLLSFSNKRKSFVGLIPNDQSGIVNGIRQVITQHKQRMMQQIPGQNPMGGQVPGMPGMGQTIMGGMVPGPVTAPTATQMPGGTMGLQQNRMALDQDPQMVNSAAGLSPSKYTMEYADQCAHKRRHAEEISVLPVTKQRRLALKQEGLVNQITQESLDCTTYQSGIGHDIDADIETIPDPVPRGVFKPVTLDGTPTYVVIDLETTDLIRGDQVPHITQISAQEVLSGAKFNSYVIPKLPISPCAERVTKICMKNDTEMMVNGVVVESYDIHQALTLFLNWLSSYDNVILLAHNGRRFDFVVLCSALCNCDLIDRYVSIVCGLVDTLPVFRSEVKNQGSYKQADLARSLLNLTYNCHNAEDDVSSLTALFKYVNGLNNMCFLRKSFLPYDIILTMQRSKEKRKNLPSLLNLISSGVVKMGMAENIASSGLNYNHLKTIYCRNGEDGLHNVFQMKNRSGQPRVTNAKKTLESVIPKLATHFDYLKENNLNYYTQN